jgi:DNA-binding transcriptional regulator YiaG
VQRAATFAKEVRAVLTRRKLCERKVAKHFSVSVATIARWKSGKSSPHHALREFVLRDLEEID